MNNQPVWFPDKAARFIELLKINDWNTAVRLLREKRDLVTQLEKLKEGERKSA